MKRILLFLVIGILFLFRNGMIIASGFNLKSIGEVDTSGRQISQWWYSGLAPIFRGEASPGAVVEIDIDGEKNSVTADELGDWTYNTPILTEGDHSVVLSSSESNISFTLSIGAENVNWDAVGSGGDEALPAAGIIWPGLIMILTGAGGIVGGGKMIRASKR